MKKILLLFCCILNYSATNAQDQARYVVELNIDYIKNTGNGVHSLTYQAYIKTGVSKDFFFDLYCNGSNADKNAVNILPNKPALKSYPVGLLPDAIWFWWRRASTSQDDKDETQYRIDKTKPYIRAEDVISNDLFSRSEVKFDLYVYPEKINIAYVGNDREEQKLPSDERITLKATKGFPAQLYNWKYSVDSSRSWKDIPNDVTVSADRTEITFNGYELAGEEVFRSKLYTSSTIQIGISYDNSPIPQFIFVLNPSLTAPKIVDIKPLMGKCAGDNGTLEVLFDRQLIPGEKLYLTLNDKTTEEKDSLSINSNNKAFLPSVEVGTYQIRVVSSYNGFTSYTGLPEHTRSGVEVKTRPSINFEAQQDSLVSCYGGSSGTITVKASRESKAHFTARLYQTSTGQEIQSIQSTDSEQVTFDNLKAETYDVKLTDENGCNPKTDNGAELVHTIQIDQPPRAVGVSGDIVFLEPRGHDTKDGFISFQIVGGRGDYVVQVVDAQTGISPPCSIAVDNKNCGVVSGIGRGTYKITVTDQSYKPAFGTTCGCRYDFEYTVTAPDPIVPEITNHKDALCYSDNNGSVTMTAKGGRPYDPGLYDYLWYRTGESTPFFNDSKKTASKYSLLTAGDYKVMVIDGNDIHAELEFAILEPNPVRVNFAANNISCHGGSDGRVSVVAQGGSGQYKGQLIGGENYSKELTFDTRASAEFTGLAVGNYYLYLTDTNGCPMRDNDDVSKVVEYYEIVVTEPKKPVKIERIDTQLPISHQSADGVAVVQVWGGTTQNGAYQVVAKSVEGGRVYAPSASVPNGVYTAYTFTGLQAGRYLVEASDQKYINPSESPCGCVDRVEVEFTAPAPMAVVLKELEKVSCYGSNTAQVVAYAQGGTRFIGSPMPYKYQWYKVNRGVSQAIDVASDSIALNLSAGSYRVEVFDAKEVSVASDVLTVGEPDSLSVSFEITDIDCSGANTGSIKATVQGGTAPYAYQWNVSGQNAPNLSNLERGIYTFKVTDSNGCSMVAQVEVKSAVEITVDSIIVQPNCLRPNGGHIELNLSGGSAPYTAQWSDNNSSQLKREQLSAGTYRVVITDNKGCKVPYSFTLHEPHSFTVALPADFTMCRNQSRTIKAVCAERGVAYKWYCDAEELAGSENSITASKAGVYRVVATNQVGCTAQDEVVVAVSDESLNLDMIAPTRVAAGSEIHAVNLSTVSAEVLTWSLPKEALVLKRGDTEVIFMLDKAGHYEIALKGEKSGCSTVVTRTIEVVGSGDEQLPNDKKALIKQFLVTPNPTKGYFKVLVELNREDDFTMKLYSPSGVLVDEKKGVKVQNKSFEYEINGSIQGTYLLHLITPYDKAVLQVVIKN